MPARVVTRKNPDTASVLQTVFTLTRTITLLSPKHKLRGLTRVVPVWLSARFGTSPGKAGGGGCPRPAPSEQKQKVVFFWADPVCAQRGASAPPRAACNPTGFVSSAKLPEHGRAVGAVLPAALAPGRVGLQGVAAGVNRVAGALTASPPRARPRPGYPPPPRSRRRVLGSAVFPLSRVPEGAGQAGAGQSRGLPPPPRLTGGVCVSRPCPGPRETNAAARCCLHRRCCNPRAPHPVR